MEQQQKVFVVTCIWANDYDQGSTIRVFNTLKKARECFINWVNNELLFYCDDSAKLYTYDDIATGDAIPFTWVADQKCYVPKQIEDGYVAWEVTCDDKYCEFRDLDNFSWTDYEIKETVVW
jgi:hypothetical protein